MNSSIRLDTYLWAIRLYKSRTLATDAIKGGKLKLNDTTVKASHLVKVGENYTINCGHGIKKIIEVKTLIDKRQSYAVAKECYIDHSPPIEKTEHVGDAFYRVTIKRDKGVGRPTKKDRRDMNRSGWGD